MSNRLSTKEKALLKLKQKRTKPFGLGQFGGGGAGTQFSPIQEEQFELKKDTLWVPIQQSYNEAFANARKKGLKTFMFNGELKNTELGNDPKAQEAGAKRFQNIGLIPIERTKKIQKEQSGGIVKSQEQIANTVDYGWEGQNNRDERSWKFSTVNPGHSFFNPFHWAGDGWRYMMHSPREEFSTPHEEAMYERYMGGKRNMEHLPFTSIRFSRDYNENNQVNKTKEYVAVPKEQKDAVREQVIPNMKDKLKPGEWVQVKDNVRRSRDVRGTGNRLSAYGKFGLRNNNNSGIYDMVDTYDFPDWVPIPDRNKGYELEVRDTIWTKDAKPELYKVENSFYPYNKQPK